VDKENEECHITRKNKPNVELHVSPTMGKFKHYPRKLSINIGIKIYNENVKLFYIN